MTQPQWQWAATLSATLSLAWLLAAPGAWGGPHESGSPGSAAEDAQALHRLHPAGTSRMSCADIVRKVDQQPRQPADPGEIGEKLSQNSAWVERCMVMYGRRVRKPAAVDLDAKEDEQEIWESSEAEETGQDETGDAQKPARAEATPRPTRRPREKLDEWQK